MKQFLENQKTIIQEKKKKFGMYTKFQGIINGDNCIIESEEEAIPIDKEETTKTIKKENKTNENE